MDAIRCEGDSKFETKIGPAVRYGSRTDFIELRVAHSSSPDQTEARIRMFKAR